VNAKTGDNTDPAQSHASIAIGNVTLAVGDPWDLVGIVETYVLDPLRDPGSPAG